MSIKVDSNLESNGGSASSTKQRINVKVNSDSTKKKKKVDGSKYVKTESKTGKGSNGKGSSASYSAEVILTPADLFRLILGGQ